MNLKATARTLAAIAALVASPLMARAATTPVTPHPITVEFGFNWTTNSTTQVLVKTVYDFQIDYDLTGGTGKAPVSVYGGYGWANHAPIAGAKVTYNLWSLGVQTRTKHPVYAGMGFGYYGQSGTVSVAGVGSASTGQGGVGAQGFVGVDLFKPGRAGPGVKLGYNVLPSFQGLNTDSWFAALTYRI